VHVPKPSTTKRTSFLDKTSNNPNDFMSNISSNLPQWPEPEAQWPETEETLGQPPSESDPFIRHHHSTFDPQGVVHIQRSRNREKGSKESISSSWSSLFNGLPGTSSGTVSIQPNSGAVSNLSSSGSGHNSAAKVAFIGNKYRNNKPNS
jgi:hypothetical protein